MSRPIDEKIVKMKMDNQDFKSKADETIGIFGRLRSSLDKIPGVNLGKTTRELGNINTAAGSVQMGKLQTAVETISNRFSTLGIIGITALQNITNKAIDTGEKMLKALTTDGIKDGFREYELKMGSIQTIMSNTQGKNNLEEVTGVLNELNEYSDKTIYSFSEMTSNIGRFTAAGVGLKDSAMAIKGISNLAAVSGSNSQQAATGMYQLSQALSSGSVKLMDWNSVVNAGMGGKVFQDALSKTADELGKGRDKSVSFRDSLQDGWITSEVLLKTLGKFSTDESMLEAATKVRTFTQLIATTKEAIGSGWAQSWELIVGDFNESGALWSGIAAIMSTAVGDSAKARNELIGGWVDAGGMKQVFRGLKNIFEGLSKIMGAVSDGFHSMFPKATIGTLKNMSESFVVFTDKFKFADSTITKLTKVFTGLFSIFSTGWEIAKLLGREIKQMMPSIDEGGILDWIVGIADMAAGFNASVKEGNKLTKFISGISEMFGKAATKLSEISGIKLSKDGIIAFFNGETSGVITKLSDALGKIKTTLGKAATALKGFIGGLGMTEVLGVGAAGGMFLFGKKILEVLANILHFVSAPEQVKNSIKGLFDAFGDSLNAFTSRTKYSNLMKIAIALGILALSIKLLETISWPNMGKGLLVLGIALGGLVIAFQSIAKINMSGFSSVKVAITLIALAVAVALISKTVSNFTDISTTDLANGMVAVGGIILLLVASLKLLSGQMAKTNTSNSVKTAITLVALAIAVAIMASAMRKMSAIDSESLIKGGIALTTVVTMIVGAFAVLGKIKPPSLKSMVSFILFTIGLQQAAIAMLIFSAALYIMLPAIEKIGTMDTAVLTQGLIGMTVALMGIGIAMKLTKGSFGGAVGMLVAVGVLALFIPIIERFGTMNLNVLGQGMGVMAGGLALLVIALKLAKGTMGGAIALVIAAGALNLLLVPLTVLGNMSLSQIGTALLALGGSLVIIGLAAFLLQPVIPAMLALGVSLALIGLAVLLAGGGLMLLNTALTLFAATSVTVVAAVITALGLLIVGITELIPKVELLISALILAIAMVIIKNLPIVIVTAGTIIIALLQGIVDYLPKVLELGVGILVILMLGIIQYLPVLIATAVMVIIAFISGLSDAIRDNGPQLIKEILGLIGEVLIILGQAIIAVIDSFLGWIPGVSENLKKGSEELGNVIRDRFDGESLGENIDKDTAKGIDKGAPALIKSGEVVADKVQKSFEKPDFKNTGKNAVREYTDGMTGEKPVVEKKAFDIASATATVMDLVTPKHEKAGEDSSIAYADGLGNMDDLLKKAGVDASMVGLEGAKTPDYTPVGKEKTKEIAKGVHEGESGIKNAAKTVMTAGRTSAASVKTYDTGINFGMGLVNGILHTKPSVQAAARTIGNAGVVSLRNVMQERSPSKLTFQSGIYFGEGLINGIHAKVKGVGNAAAEMASKALASMNNFISEFAESFIPEEEDAYEFRLKPILDLKDMVAYPDQNYGLTPDTSGTNLRFSQVAASFGQNGNKSTETIKKGDYKVHNTIDVNISIEGGEGLMDDFKFIDKLKTVITNDVVVGNRTLPNRTSLMEF